MSILFDNNISTTLNGAILSTDLTITVTDGSVFPDPTNGTVIATLENASTHEVEIIHISGISTNDLTVSRGQDGTTALAFNDGDTVEMRITKEILESLAQKSAVNNYTAGQSGQITTLTDGATITPNMSDSNNFTVTLGGNRTLANPSNIVAGQSGFFEIKQDATGSRTLALGSYFKTVGGAGITLSTAANAVDTLEYRVRSTTEIDVVLNKAWA